jgi:hypothetical protein
MKYAAEGLRLLKQSPFDCVIPAWSAGIQVHMDVPEASLRIWMPAIHAGMTKSAFLLSIGERKIHESLRVNVYSSHSAPITIPSVQALPG